MADRDTNNRRHTISRCSNRRHIVGMAIKCFSPIPRHVARFVSTLHMAQIAPRQGICQICDLVFGLFGGGVLKCWQLAGI